MTKIHVFDKWVYDMSLSSFKVESSLSGIAFKQLLGDLHYGPNASHPLRQYENTGGK